MTQPRSRTSATNGHIVITGTGRAGTTFLVQLFTALGFDTGFSLDQAMRQINAISHAGLERPSVHGANPYVIKSPWFADQLPDALENRRTEIYAAIIPLRELFQAAESRRRVYREALAKGFDPLKFPGTLWHTSDPRNQEEKLAAQFYKAVFPLVKYEIPVYFLEFPRIVRDEGYLFRKLKPLMEDHGVGQSEFQDAYRSVAKPHLVHEFEE